MILISQRQTAEILTAGGSKAKLRAAAVSKHIENARLAELQGGAVELNKWERQHLRKCMECQEVLYFFVTLVSSASEPPAFLHL